LALAVSARASAVALAKKKGPPTPDAHAISFLAFARQYQKAANLLYESDKTLKAPTYFMYMHAIELALKAFLRAAGCRGFLKRTAAVLQGISRPR
jgi:hypothetical protein